MNPFEPVITRARHGGLFLSVPPAISAYWASPSFAARTLYSERVEQVDQLAIVYFMLDRLALNPATGAAALEALSRGEVNLDFFQTSSPAGLFFLEVGSPELADLVAAVQRNLAGPRTDAVRRWQRWQTPRKVHQRYAFYDKTRATFRESFEWPRGDGWGHMSESDRARQSALYQAVEEHSRAVKSRRLDRLNSLLAQATLHNVSYYQFLEEIALHVLAPEDGAPVH